MPELWYSDWESIFMTWGRESKIIGVLHGSWSSVNRDKAMIGTTFDGGFMSVQWKLAAFVRRTKCEELRRKKVWNTAAWSRNRDCMGNVERWAMWKRKYFTKWGRMVLEYVPTIDIPCIRWNCPFNRGKVRCRGDMDLLRGYRLSGYSEILSECIRYGCTWFSDFTIENPWNYR